MLALISCFERNMQVYDFIFKMFIMNFRIYDLSMHELTSLIRLRKLGAFQ